MDSKCPTCQLTKIEKKHIPARTESRTTKVLELLHIDTAGPFEEGREGGKYRVCITDDYSGFGAVYTECTKRDCALRVISFIKWAERQTAKKVARVRCDQTPEFVSGNLGNFCQEHGIQIETSPPYRPALNGVSERKNRTLNEMTAAILEDSGLSELFWPDATSMANFILNRTMNKRLGKTPFEVFMDRKPNLKNLRVFGAKAWVRKGAPIKSKLSKKAVEARLIGYNPTCYVFITRSGR